MKLQPLSSSHVQLDGTQPSGARQVRSTTSDTAQFSAAEGVDKALEDAPDVRAEKVARAKELIASVKYPPAEIIDSISHLVAEKL